MKIKGLWESENQRTATVKKNIVASLFIKGLSIMVSLMLVPMTLGYLSDEMYGVWLTLSSVIMWLGFFDIGFTLGLKNKLAEAIALEDWERGRSLVSTTYFMMTIIFVPLCIVLELLVSVVDWSAFLNVNTIYNEEIINTLYVLVAFFCIQMIANVLTTVIAAFQKVALSSLFAVLGNILSLGAIGLLAKYCPPSLMYLAFAISTMPILVILTASLFLYHSQLKKVAPQIKSIKTHHIKDLFSLGARFFLIQIQVVVLFQFTNVLISNVSSPQDVTAYNIAYKYMGIAMMAYSIILTPLWPAFTDAYTKEDFPWMKSVYNKMAKIFIVSFFIMLLMVCLSPLAYHLWIGEKATIPFTMTITVCLYMAIQNWDSLQVNLINGIGVVKLQTYVTMIGLVIHIPLSLFLGNRLGLGAVGVVISMILINLFYSIVFTMQIRKILNQKAFGIWMK